MCLTALYLKFKTVFYIQIYFEKMTKIAETYRM
jgi:hypothetical protein